MKSGYIVWNESTAGSEFYGVYRTQERAEKALRKWIKEVYGVKLKPDYEDQLIDIEVDTGGEDSHKITYFEEGNI